MLAQRYLRTDFASQEDFERNFALNIPPHFHFAYDVVDEYARTEPQKRAMIWCDVHGRERVFTFADFSRLSDRAANVFKAQGLKKGDPVLLMLKRRYQFWIAALGLLKTTSSAKTRQLSVSDGANFPAAHNAWCKSW